MTRSEFRAVILAAAGLGIGIGSASAQSAADGDLVPDVRVQDASAFPVQFEPQIARLGGPLFVSTQAAPESDAPADVAFTPDGARYILANRESQNLTIHDAATGAFVSAIQLGGGAQSVAITPDGATAVVALVTTDEIAIVDLVTEQVTAVIPAFDNPGVVRIMPGGDLAAVGLAVSGEIAVVDIASAAIVRTIGGIGYLQLVSVNPEWFGTDLQYSSFEVIDGDRILHTQRNPNLARFINVRTGVVNDVSIAADASPPAVSLDRGTAAIAHTGSTQLITVLDTATETVRSTIPAPEGLGFGFGAIAVNADGTSAVVAVQNASRWVDLVSGVFGSRRTETASINEYLANFNGTRAVGIGFRGPVWDLDTGALLGLANEVVSTSHGAVSPTADLAIGISTTFGEDAVAMETDASPRLLRYELTGPRPEGDRCRTAGVSPDGSVAVGLSVVSDTLTIIDTASGAVTGAALTGERPSGVAITPDGSTAVVCNSDSFFSTVIDLATGTSTNVAMGRRGAQVAISPDGRSAYVPVVADGDGVYRIDIASRSLDGPKILTGNMGSTGFHFRQSSDMELSPDGSLLAVAGSFSDSVTLIDTASWSFLTDLFAGDFPCYVAFSPDNALLAASDRDTDTVRIWDLATPASPALLSTVAVGDGPGEMAFTADGRLFVINFNEDTVGEIDIAAGTQTRTIAVDPDRTIIDVTVDQAGGRLLVTSGASSATLGGTDGVSTSESGALGVYDLTTLALVEEIELGAGPADAAWSDDRSVGAIAALISEGVVLPFGVDSCEPDLTGDGMLDLFDILEFFARFGEGDLSVDFDASGALDLFDILGFFALFGAGC